MENRASIVFKSSMRYGAYLGPALIVINLFFYLAFDLSKFSYWPLIGLMFLFSALPVVLGIYFCMKFFRDRDMSGFMTYGEGLRFGTTLMLFSGLFLAGYNLVFNNWIDSNYAGKVVEIITEKTVVYYEQIGMPASEIDKLISSMDELKAEQSHESKMQAPLMSIPIYAFVGMVLSLVIAAILKRKGDPFASAMRNID